MYQIPVYKAEREAGLEPLIRAASSFAYTIPLGIAQPPSPSPARPNRFPEHAKASSGDMDLYYLKAVLATAGVWNNNDDVFDLSEVWAARSTPEDKPVNYNHDCADIVGHILGSYAVDDDGGLIADDSAVDDLPSKYHVITPSVLYRFWSKADLQERMDTLIPEIEAGEWSVSMECLFHNFDYAVRYPDGREQIVARNNQTSYLTKHLRIYKGTGEFNGAKIGRLPRQFVFSGKGIVKTPANPDSIIFSNATAFVTNASAFIPLTPQASVYSDGSAEVTAQENEKTMPTETDKLAADLATANEKIKTLEAKLLDNTVQAKASVEAKVTGLETKITETLERTTALESENKALKAELATANEKVVAAEKATTDLNTQLTEAKAAEVKRDRVAKLMDHLKVDKDGAEDMANNLEGLDDDKFHKHVDHLTKSMAVYDKSMTMETPGIAEGNPDQKPGAKKPGKQTPAPLPPKATSLKAPMRTDASEGETEINADPENLDGAEPEAGQASLALDPASTGVNDVQKAIASFLGYEDGDQ